MCLKERNRIWTCDTGVAVQCIKPTCAIRSIYIHKWQSRDKATALPPTNKNNRIKNINKALRRTDLNRRHPAYEAGELTTALLRINRNEGNRTLDYPDISRKFCHWTTFHCFPISYGINIPHIFDLSIGKHYFCVIIFAIKISVLSLKTLSTTNEEIPYWQITNFASLANRISPFHADWMYNSLSSVIVNI